jgi:hypothetical protein
MRIALAPLAVRRHRLVSQIVRILPFLVLGGLVLLGTVPVSQTDESSRVFSPEDERIIEMLEDLLELPLGVEVATNSASLAQLVLGQGFDVPEADATWLIGEQGYLDFRVPGGGATRLDLAVYPFVGGPVVEREVEVTSSEGTRRFTMKAGGQLLSVSLDAEQEDHQVVISCPEVGSPSDLQLGSDVRSLCLKMISLTVQAE